MTIMPSEKKYKLWPSIIIVFLAFVAPVTIGTIELRLARNAQAETEAYRQLQAIAKAEAEYRTAHQTYSASLDDLNGLKKAEAHYRYDYRRTSGEMFSVTAEPMAPGKHGKRYFYLDESGVIRYEVLHAATATSPVVPAASDGKSGGSSGS